MYNTFIKLYMPAHTEPAVQPNQRQSDYNFNYSSL